MKKKSAYDAVAERMTQAVLEQLSTGIVPWRQPWQQLQGAINGISGKPYRGANQLLLACRPTRSRTFLTFNQGLSLGGSLAKGSKGTPIMFWTLRGEQRNEHNQVTERGVPLVRHSFVFPLEDFGGIPLDKVAQRPQPQLHVFTPDERAEQLLAAIQPAPCILPSGSAAYAPLPDVVYMPDLFTFESAEAYYATLFHELGHWSGHASRLDRNLRGRFGSEAYAREELVAELTACFLGCECQLEQPGSESEQQHAAYLAGWMKRLRDHPRLLLEASGQAQKAADFLLGRERADTELVPVAEQRLAA